MMTDDDTLWRRSTNRNSITRSLRRFQRSLISFSWSCSTLAAAESDCSPRIIRPAVAVNDSIFGRRPVISDCNSCQRPQFAYLSSQNQKNAHFQLPRVLLARRRKNLQVFMGRRDGSLHVWVISGVSRIVLDILLHFGYYLLSFLFIVVLLLYKAPLLDFLRYRSAVLVNNNEYMNLTTKFRYQ